MSLPVPLSVRLQTGRQDRHITRDLRDLTFRSVAPGGFASLQVALDRPLHIAPDEVDYYATATVCGPDGRTLWEGRLEDPGRGATSDGLVWDVAAVGPSAHASDRKRPVIYVDRDLRAFYQADKASAAALASVGGDPGDTTGERQALVMSFPRGVGMSANARAVMRYSRIRETGQKLARIAYTHDAGLTSPNLNNEAIARVLVPIPASDTVASPTWTTAGGTASGVVVTNFSLGRNVLDLRAIYTDGAAPVPDDTWWASFYDVAIRAVLRDKSGGEITTGYTLNTVLASEVVADLLGRILTNYDGPGATIATTSFPIEQLAYPEGVIAAHILADLMALEPAYYWAAWERNPANNRNRFEWTTWPTTVRYEASAADGFDSPASAADLFNAVMVRWVDAAGVVHFTPRSQTIAAMDAAGIVREAYLDLGGDASSSASATQAGDAFLAEHKTPPNAGTLTVARPIVDLVGGGMVQPYEIRPGTLIRVRGVLPRIDSLNATDRDGVTVFRVVGVTYRASSASAQLDLDSYPRTVAQALANLRRPTRLPALQRR